MRQGESMTGEQPKAIGLIRTDVPSYGVGLHAIAGRNGYRLVYTVALNTGPLVAALVITGHIHEHNAAAVVVGGFEHVDMVRHIVTDLAVLITPMQVYPLGYRWPATDLGEQ